MRGFHSRWLQGTEEERGAFDAVALPVPSFWFETDTDNTYVWNGTAWQAWSAASGGGDMLKSIYDTDDNGVVDTASYANDADTVDEAHLADIQAEIDSDIAAHAAIEDAHQEPVTLDANADTLLSLAAQELGLDTQAAHTILSGPQTGGDAAPTFRALIAADIPTLLIYTRYAFMMGR